MPVPSLDILIRFTVATLVGALIGLDREIRHKPAGLRTHALVALGAAVATALVTSDTTVALRYDALSRVIQGIITGIGFLGAGVILRAENGRSVHGLTTAASIWLAACLGSACGAGAWMIAASAFLLVMLVLIAGGALERWAIAHLRRDHDGDAGDEPGDDGAPHHHRKCPPGTAEGIDHAPPAPDMTAGAGHRPVSRN